MIMKANKQIGFIYKDNESIDKILKDGDVVFERGFLRERTTTTLPINFGGVGKDLKDYKIYGNTVQSKLPSGYTQVDYIESSGTQYIDTGVNADNNLRVVIDFAYTNKNLSNQNIGAIKLESGNNARYHILLGGTSTVTKIRVFVNDSGNNTINDDTERHLYDINPSIGQVLVDNVSYTIPSGIRDTGLNFWLFGRNSTSTIYLSKVKQWACKMYYSNVLVRDFIPCYRNTDNEVGLYDLVNNVFYTNEGTGAFTYGSIAPTPDTPIEMVSVGDNKTGLPFGYTQVDYIQSSGSQYIDTGVKGNQDTKVNLDFEGTNFSYAGNKSIIGSRTSATEKHYGITISGGANPYLYSGYNNVSQQGVQISLNTKYNVFKDKNIMYLDNTEITNATYTTFETSTNMFIFAMNEGGAKFYSSIKLFKLKIYNDNELVRDFIPCYRNSDNEVGLYDLVNKVFYTNQGTGSFTYGSEIEKGGYKIPVNVRSDNLFDKDSTTKNEFLDSNGDIVERIDNVWYLSDYIPVKPNKNYTYQGLTFVGTAPYSAYYDINKNFISTFKQAIGQNTILIPNNACYVRFSIINRSKNKDLPSFMIEEGSTAPSKYIPYYNETINIYLDEPLRKIGEYSDYIDFINGKVVRNIGKKIFNGTEHWSIYNNKTYSASISNYARSNNIPYSKYFKGESNKSSIDYMTNNNTIAFNDNKTNNRFYLYSSKLPTPTEIINFLTNNPMEVDYVLETPTEETITLPNIPTIDGNNTLNIETEITPSQVYIKYKSNN